MKIIEDTELKCNKEIAELLYMGLVSDSNRFLFNSATANTFQRVSNYLRDYDFDLSEIYNKLYLRPLSEVRLEGYISLNMKVTDNKLGYVVISNDIINTTIQHIILFIYNVSSFCFEAASFNKFISFLYSFVFSFGINKSTTFFTSGLLYSFICQTLFGSTYSPFIEPLSFSFLVKR